MRFRLPLIIGLTLFSILLSTAHSAQKLKIVADYWPPFTTEQKGQRMAADMVEAALSNADISHQTKILPWTDVLAGVKKGKYDAIVGAWKNQEREAYLVFSKPYLENRIKLVGRVDNIIKYTSIKQLYKKKVGLVKDYAYGPEITENKNIIQVTGTTVADNIKRLLDKKIDYLLADSIVAQAMEDLLPKDVKKNLVIYEKAVLIKPLYFALRKDYPGAKAVLEKFNTAISQMIADGSYNTILGFSWVLADTNSDGVYEYIAGNNTKPQSTDPALQRFGYQVFTEEEAQKQSLAKAPPLKYRILNQNYDSWHDAQKAIQNAYQEGVSPNEDTSDTFNFLIGKW